MVTRRDQRGVALIFVLWLLVLLGVIIADVATLHGLFGQFTSDARADTVAAALKAAPIRRLAELSRVPGIDDSLALAVAPYVTVWSDGLVNINSAPEAVLAALPGLAAAAPGIVARREAGEVFVNLDPVHQPSMPGVVAAVLLVSTVPTRLMLVSRGWQDGHPLTHEIQAVFAIVGRRLVLQSSWEREL